MTPMILKEYVGASGDSPFGIWFTSLNAVAAAKVAVALNKIERGALSNVKPVGEGVSEFRIDFGPGYRVYFGMDGQTLIILLTGGTKKRQQQDINTAKTLWADYKARKKGRF
jgi:putative addiction module killer protein